MQCTLTYEKFSKLLLIFPGLGLSNLRNFGIIKGNLVVKEGFYVFRKIESKIIAAIIICCIIVMGVQGTSTLFRVNETLNQDVENLTYSIVDGKKNLIEQKIQTVRLIADNITDIVTEIIDPNQMMTKGKDYETIIDPIVKKIVENNIDDVMGVYLIFDPEKTTDVYGAYYEDVEVVGNVQALKKHEKKYFVPDNERMSWYYDCIDIKEGKWFEPYTSSRGIEMVSYTVPIYKDNTYIAMLSIDLNFKQFKKYVTDIELLHSGYLFVLNEKFDFIMHRTLTFEDNFETYDNNVYANIAQAMAAGDKQIVELTYEGIEKSMAYEKLSNGWYLCGVINRDVLTQNNKELVTVTIYNFIFALVLSVIIALIVGKTISSSTSYVTKSINTLSNLDLTLDEKDRKRSAQKQHKDELGVMISSVINLRQHLRNIIPTVMKNSKSTLNFADNLKTSMDSSNHSMNQIALTMTQLSESSDQQILNAKQGVERLAVLADMIEQAIHSANDVQSTLEETQSTNRTNIQQIQNLSEKFEAYVTSSNQVSESIGVLSERTKDIGAIVKTINAIATQTKLLSLNASIEAAHAGEHGKGFATVAEEIRQLSASTAKETAQIQEIVDELNRNMQATVESMQKGEEALGGAKTAMAESKGSFDMITRDVAEMAGAATTLISATAEINQNKDEVVSVIHSIHDSCQENASNARGIMETIQFETNNISKLAEASAELIEISQQLDEMMSQFKIEQE